MQRRKKAISSIEYSTFASHLLCLAEPGHLERPRFRAGPRASRYKQQETGTAARNLARIFALSVRRQELLYLRKTESFTKK